MLILQWKQTKQYLSEAHWDAIDMRVLAHPNKEIGVAHPFNSFFHICHCAQRYLKNNKAYHWSYILLCCCNSSNVQHFENVNCNDEKEC